MGKWILAALCMASSSVWAQQQLTGYEAMKLVGRQDRAALGRIISVTGVEGDPQPTRWNILLLDRGMPGGVREIQVAKGRILGSGRPTHAVVGSNSGATLRTSELNLDSSGAFSVASFTADRSHVNFSFVNYTLRTNERGASVWVVTLQDEARRPLGTIFINASKGNVTRVEGLYRGTNPASVQEDHVERERPVDREVEARPRRGDDYTDARTEEDADEDDGDQNIVKKEIKRMFHRTKDDAQRIFRRVHRSFEEFFNR